jgi:Uma2 family endonuclease
MEDNPDLVKKRIELSASCASNLSRLVREHRMNENLIIESALNVLFNLMEDLDMQTEKRGWLILSEKLLPTDWRDAATQQIPNLMGEQSMSYEEFLEWADEDTLTEWVDGEVIIASASSDTEEVIREFLHNVLRIFVSVNKRGLVRTSRFQMKLERSGREPDLLFVATENLDRVKSAYLDGPADMVVEVSTPQNIGRDRGEKFYEYERAGIPEYWLIDPVRRWSEFYILGEKGHYIPVMYGNDGVFQSQVIHGFWLRIEWLWHPPPILQTLRELGIISPETP